MALPARKLTDTLVLWCVPEQSTSATNVYWSFPITLHDEQSSKIIKTHIFLFLPYLTNSMELGDLITRISVFKKQEYRVWKNTSAKAWWTECTVVLCPRLYNLHSSKQSRQIYRVCRYFDMKIVCSNYTMAESHRPTHDLITVFGFICNLDNGVCFSSGKMLTLMRDCHQ